MIKRAEEQKIVVNQNMRGGDGQVTITRFLEPGEFAGKSRLIGKIHLEPGCSIGEHVHENEEEIFCVLCGTAEYNDNGSVVTLHAGDSCVVLGGQKHGVANRSSEPVDLLAVILTY